MTNSVLLLLLLSHFHYRQIQCQECGVRHTWGASKSMTKDDAMCTPTLILRQHCAATETVALMIMSKVLFRCFHNASQCIHVTIPLPLNGQSAEPEIMRQKAGICPSTEDLSVYFAYLMS